MSAVLGLGRGARRVIVLALVAALFVHGTAAARAAGMPLELMRGASASVVRSTSESSGPTTSTS
jgi:hypothetical protein